MNFLVALGMGLLCLSKTAGAAQLAIVDVDKTPLYEMPNTSSKVQIPLKKGQKLAASTYPLNGYYKVKTGNGLIGWVTSETLILKKPESATSKTEIPTY